MSILSHLKDYLKAKIHLGIFCCFYLCLSLGAFAFQTPLTNISQAKKTENFSSSNPVFAEVQNNNRETGEFDQTELENYRSKSAFQYDSQPPPPSIFEQIKSFFSQFIEVEMTDGTKKNLGILIKFLIIISALVFLVKTLGGMKWKPIFKSNDNQAHKQETSTKNWNAQLFDRKNTNWNKAIGNALSKGNFREALRYHYLQLLSNLQLHNLIVLRQEKTNSDYVEEMAKHAQGDSFQLLSKAFDYYWYGNFNLNEIEYKKWESEFLKFQSNSL